MAGSTPIKVYRNGELVASCKFFQDAAAIAEMNYDTIVKWKGKKTIYKHGEETDETEEYNTFLGWEDIADLMMKRVAAIEPFDEQEYKDSYYCSLDYKGYKK